jgi:hypothetical protein
VLLTAAQHLGSYKLLSLFYSGCLQGVGR